MGAAPRNALSLYENTDYNGNRIDKRILVIPDGASANDFNLHGFKDLASSAVNRTGRTQRLYNQENLSGTHFDVAVGELERLEDFNDRARSAVGL
ncbi:peptidase inhibitor family I36 protein [Streptomyces goshikiensis]